jgi:hypothetical protein
MPRFKRYEVDSYNDWTEWVQPIEQGYKFCCCDCGLVHQMNFRIEDGRVQLQVKRDNRSTGQIRRHERKRKDSPS